MVIKVSQLWFLDTGIFSYVSNIKVDIFSFNNKRRNLCRRGGGGCSEIVFLAGFRKSAPGLFAFGVCYGSSLPVD